MDMPETGPATWRARDRRPPLRRGSLGELLWWGAHAPALLRVSARAVAAHGGDRRRVMVRLRRLRRRGFTFEEALEQGLLDPALPDDVVDGYAPRHVALIAQARLNAAALEPLTTEKAIFYRLCAALGLPVPELLAIVPRETAAWGAGDRVITDGAGFADHLLSLGRDLIVKPSGGGQGVGVRLLRREPAGLVDAATGEAVDAARLWDELRADPDHACFVVQERVRNHPDVARLVPATALHTMRIATLVPADGGPPRVSQCSIRLGIGGGVTDNFAHGRTGNGYCEIDPATGLLGPFRRAREDGCGFVDSPDLPDGRRIEGTRMPMWDESLALASRAAIHFLPVRSIGWDIAVTDRGPMIIEANRMWTPFPQPRLADRLAELV